jgi:subtilase family serine protease
VAVVNGSATVAVSGLAAGTHLFTARFAPSDPSLLESVGGTTHAVEQPDLVPAFGPLPPGVAPGARLIFTETTSNIGLAYAGPSTTRYFLSNDAVFGGDIALGLRSIVGLAPAAQSAGALSLTVPGSTPLGSYYVIACADAADAIWESSETNNCIASAAVSVSRADLVVTSASAAAQSATPGGTFTVADTVQNQGGIASASSTTRFYLSVDASRSADDRVAGSRSVGPLAAGASSFKADSRLTVSSTTPLGLYLVVACADDPTKTVELSEANNCTAAAGQLRVGRPDLTIASVSEAPSTIAPGRTFSATAATAIAGSASSGSSTTRFYFSVDATRDASDVLLTGSISVAALAPGQTSSSSKTLTVPATMADGSYRLLACADDTGTTMELNEGNNCSASGASVSVGRPDLTESAVTNPPATVVAGRKFAVTDTAANVGTVASASTSTRYYLSRDTIKSGDDALVAGARSVPALAPGTVSTGAKTVTVPTLPAGTYYLIACADATAVAIESREDNNCVTSVTSTTLP